MKKQSNGFGFVIHNFMILLNLTSSELLIYALLYAYSQDRDGIYFGSLEYIATRTGVSVRTVGRAIDKLISEGLITRCTVNGVSGIRAVMSVAERIKRIESAACEDEGASVSDERKEKKTEACEKPKRQVVPGRFLFPDVNTGKIYDTEPKYRLIEVGKDKVVRMTVEQYEKLKSLIPDIELKRYIDRLAAIHIERSGMKDYWRKCDYRILRDWIKEDYRA